MASVLNVKNLEQLKPFLNKDGLMEIVVRDKKKKFKTFQKVALENLQQSEKQEAVKKALDALNKNINLSEKNLKMLGAAVKLEKLSFVLNGLNLCATCAGFAIMNEKLKKISEQINKVLLVVKEEHDSQRDFEFKKVCNEHIAMLDSRKTKKWFSEEKMRELVDMEHSVLELLIKAFMKELSADPENLVISIYSLAAMLTVSIKFFDELYYFNNKESIDNGDVWYSNHEVWMSTFDKMLSDEFMAKIQDHGLLDLKLSTYENDVYYLSLKNQVIDMIEDIKDNQQMIQILDDRELVNNYYNYVRESAAEDIKESFDEAEVNLDEELERVYQEAIKQVILAI